MPVLFATQAAMAATDTTAYTDFTLAETRMQIGTQLYGMRGWDPGASAYRSWPVFGSPDYTAAQYTGPGAGTLTGVVVAWQRSILT